MQRNPSPNTVVIIIRGHLKQQLIDKLMSPFEASDYTSMSLNPYIAIAVGSLRNVSSCLYGATQK